jgi:hypothetical protein
MAAVVFIDVHKVQNYLAADDDQPIEQGLFYEPCAKNV